MTYWFFLMPGEFIMGAFGDSQACGLKQDNALEGSPKQSDVGDD